MVDIKNRKHFLVGGKGRRVAMRGTACFNSGTLAQSIIAISPDHCAEKGSAQRGHQARAALRGQLPQHLQQTAEASRLWR